MFTPILYYYYALRYPELRDFVDMGLGIEARYRRCKRFWDSHLEKSKIFVQQGLDDCYGRGVVILGSGRLYDIDTLALAQKFARILCVDADPSSVRPAQKKFPLGTQVEFLISEITHTLAPWTHSLRAFLKTKNNRKDSVLVDFLSTLVPEVSKLRIEDYEAVVSLNLLGQIPLYWRDRAQSLIAEFTGKKLEDDGEFSEPLRSAIRHSMEALQRAHLRLLESSNARKLVLIYDSNFRYYTADGEVLSELGAFVDPGEALKSFTLETTEEWTWEIAPLNREQEDYGIRHGIKAQIFRHL